MHLKEGRISYPFGSSSFLCPWSTRGFFRFTRYGLKTLIEEVGLSVIEIKACGGILSFCLTPLSMIDLILGHKFSLTKKPILFFNSYWSKIIVNLDGLIDKPGIYGLNYVAVGGK